MRAPDDRFRPEQTEQSAADWLVRRDRGFSPAEQDAFSQWLAADPRHGEAFARQQQTWREFNLLAEWRPEHSAVPNPDLLARSPRKRHWLPWTAVTLAAAAAGILAVLQQPPVVSPPAERAVLVVPAERYERRVLADGSVVQLNRGAALDVRYSATERRVDLVSGEAHFTVTKQPARPFVVMAAGVGVRAVGTAFNVKLTPGTIDVLVTEGTVALDPPADEPTQAEVSAGHRAIRSRDGTSTEWEIRPASAEQVTELLAWQPVLLDFAATPLSDVVAEFNRRNAIQLLVADEELAALPIVASFRSDSIEAFVRLLEITANVRAERRGDREIVLRRK